MSLDDLGAPSGQRRIVPRRTEVREFVLRSSGRRTRHILCLGAHCDDIEIGCGGTLLALQASGKVRVHWVVLSGTPERKSETQAAMRALIQPAARGGCTLGDFPDGRFPARYAEIKQFVEGIKSKQRPDLILCHERDDRHQDHRIVNELVWNTFRDHVVLEYEIPKWDGGLGQPNVYVPVTALHVRKKIAALLRCHRSQGTRDWFSRETFMSLLRLRGIECRSASGYAEAFHARKLLLAGI
jgi:LmbE family N-acetylglucosaminyl deacetylase